MRSFGIPKAKSWGFGKTNNIILMYGIGEPKNPTNLFISSIWIRVSLNKFWWVKKIPEQRERFIGSKIKNRYFWALILVGDVNW